MLIKKDMKLGIQIKKRIKKIITIFNLFLVIFLFNNLLNAKTIIGTLNKVSGKISKIVIDDNGEIIFGTIKIGAKTCKKSPPEDPPENYAFIEIWDIKDGKEYKKVFSGWMFSSSPSISALEHAVYDVWIIDCKVF